MKIRRLLAVFIIPLVLFMGLLALNPQQSTSDAIFGGSISYTELIERINQREVSQALFSEDGRSVRILTNDNRTFDAAIGPSVEKVQSALEGQGAVIGYQAENKSGGFWSFIANLLFPILFFLGFAFLFRPGGGGAGGAFSFGKAKPKVQMEPNSAVTFNDVAGCDEAKEELQEVVTFLKTPGKFTAVGAKIPKGVLLVGAPGTGKTLLAKAVAGEAGVPFFSISGSEFVEMFVGVGASRVRDLFDRAKQNAPCIIFIDEIDAVGRQRGGGIGNQNDEREQTLNQLLTEMDGFSANVGTIVLAATNRPDVLDAALTRPGRFDRQVTIDRPDMKGRFEILKVHARDKVFDPDVDLQKIAVDVPGFTGADLANLLNEAALLTARRGKTTISASEINDSIERVIVGLEKKGKVYSPHVKRVIAYHEAGHALVSALNPNYDEVKKISIVPRGGAGGLTWFSPLDERVDSGLFPRSYFLAEMEVALGGRAAEELIFGASEITNGASSDIQRVSSRARQMIAEFGMSDELGPQAVGQTSSSRFLGRDIMSTDRNYSEQLAATVDDEVKKLITAAYKAAIDKLVERREALDEIANLLCEKEVIEQAEFVELMVKFGIFGSERLPSRGAQ
jgi:cell division protease FtsH